MRGMDGGGRTYRAALAGTMALVIGGCGGWSPAPLAGPTIVLDVSNASGSEVAVGYGLVDEGSEGAVDTVAVLPCQRGSFAFGDVNDGYRVFVDGEIRYQGRVPASAGTEDSLVITIDVEPNGQATIIGLPQVLAADEPLTPVEAIPGCEPAPSATD